MGISRGLLDRAVVRYGIAVVATAVAFVLRELLSRYFGSGLVYITFYPAVMLAAVLGGLGPGLLATALSALLADLWIIPPYWQFRIPNIGDAIGLALFMALGAFMSFVAAFYRSNRKKAAAYAAELALRESREALRQSEERLRIALESAELGTWDLNPVTGQLIWSDRCKAIFGLPPDAKVDYQTFLARVHPEDRQRVHEAVQAGLGPANPNDEYDCEFRAQWPDGTVRWIVAAGKAFFDIIDGEKRAVRATGVVQDITDRKQSQDGLQESEERIRSTFDKAAIGIVETDNQGRICNVNNHLRLMLGYDREELLGMDVRQLTFPVDRPRSDALNAQFFEGTLITFTDEKRYLRRDGSPLWVHLTVSSVRDSAGRLLRAIGTVEDITERKRAEVQLQQEKVFNEAILDNIPGMVALYDDTGHIVRWNKQHEAITGYTADEMASMHVLDWFGGREPDTSRVREQTKSVFIDGHAEVEANLLTKDGTPLQCLFTSVLLTISGKPYVLGIGVDITERKRAEDELKARADELAAINALGQAANATLSLQQAATAATQGVLDAVHSDMAFLFLREGEKLMLTEMLPPSARQSLGEIPEHQVGQCLCGLAVREGRPVYSHNIFGDFRCTWDECKRAGMKSFAALPLRSENQVIGVIGLASGTERNFEEQAGFLETLASQASVAITNARLYELARRELAERRRAENALRVSGEQLRQAVRVAGLGVFDHDHLTEAIQWSPEIRRICGWGPEESISLRDWIEGIHPDDRSRIAEAIRAAHDPAGDGLYAVEHRLVRRDGEVRWLSIRSQTFFEGEAAARHPVRTIGATLDITEQKRAEEALRESEIRYRTVFESAQDAIFVLREMRFLDCNPAAVRLFGREKEELVGGNPVAFSPGQQPDGQESAEKAIQMLRAALAGVPQRFEWRHRRPDGTEFDAEVSLTRLDVKGEPGLLALVRDITARKRAEEALGESEARYRALVELSPDAIFVNRNNRIELVNPAALALFGATSVEQVLGKPPLEMFHPDSHELVRNRIRIVLTGQSVPLVEEKVQQLDGTVRIAEVAASPFVDAQGIAIQVFLRDITERKRAEETLQQTAEELTRSNKDLEQFAYVASHDLQEPLRMVTSFMSLLQKRCRGQLDDTGMEYIQFASEGATRMQSLIEGLLAYSRVGTRGGAFTPVDCNAVLRNVLRNLQTSIEESGAVITSDPLPTVQADHTQIEQLFQNLLGNAIKFRAEGRRPEIHVGARREDGRWIFHVKDNGIGIDPQFQDKVFMIFQRLHTREAYPGAGIGLAICKRIVERHHGQIWMESQPGQGTTFFFFIPDPGAPRSP